jgi:hypothetical protein
MTLVMQQAGVLVDASSAAMVTANRAGSSTISTGVFHHTLSFAAFFAAFFA